MTKNNTTNKTWTERLAFKLLSTILLPLGICIGLLSTTASAAPKQGHIKMTSTVQKLVMVTQNGKQVPKYIPATKVLPGEIVQYSTYLKNISQEKADHIKIDNPIPAHTVYLPNSAYGKNMHITFSVDGGKHYGKAAALKVRGKDGKLHPAKASDYTHIRWQHRGSLPPKKTKLVGFKVRLL